ncbi:MAG: hypothetical protein WA766_19325, partial [Candidatus Acidiferrales bacterium]
TMISASKHQLTILIFISASDYGVINSVLDAARVLERSFRNKFTKKYLGANVLGCNRRFQLDSVGGFPLAANRRERAGNRGRRNAIPVH